MKRLLIITLALLLLAGCGTQTPTEPLNTLTPTVPDATGLYEPGNVVEQQSGGAVRAYPLNNGDYVGMAAMGNKLLLIGYEGEMTVLSGDDCEPVATLNVERNLLAMDPDLSASEMGVTYYLEKERQLVVLNPQLQESARLTLPEGTHGSPAVSLVSNRLYYCVGQEIWEMDMKTRITRMIRTQVCVDQQLTGLHFKDTVLSCRVTDEDHNSYTVYISTETGQTLSDDRGLFWLDTYEDSYVAQRLDGVILQRIVGKLEEEPKSLNVEMSGLLLTSALIQGGVVTCYEDEVGQRLAFYNTETGKRTSMVTLQGVQSPAAVYADSRFVWILASEYQTRRTVLYRWDVAKSPMVDGAVYTGELITGQKPDAEGLAQCKSRVQSLSETYDVRMELWEEGSQTGGYTMSAEYRTEALVPMLDGMEAVLKLFPEDFLRTTVTSGWIHVQLVRSVGTGAESVQYWHDGDCYVAITPEADPKFALLQGIACAIDTHVLGNSRDYDDWNDLNPKKFSYDNDYILNQMRTDLQYLEGEDMAFIDKLSMSFAHEDRSRIFAAAMLEGNKDIFKHEIMQAKLRLLCEGIREAYKLEKSVDTYPWEQYLEKSLAYGER